MNVQHSRLNRLAALVRMDMADGLPDKAAMLRAQGQGLMWKCCRGAGVFVRVVMWGERPAKKKAPCIAARGFVLVGGAGFEPATPAV